MIPTACLELIEERTFTARLHDRNITGLAVKSTWEGFTKFKRAATGDHLIVLMAESRVVSGSPALMSFFELGTDEHFVTVPARTLPSGLFVPAFQYAKYPASKGTDGKLVHSASTKPWVNVTQNEAIAACAEVGLQLARESQELSIRLDVCGVDANWTGGKVGQGKVYQGLHLGSVSSAQAADYVSCNSLERSWHMLSTGEKVYGLAGNIYTRVFDDIQGDARGLIAKKFAAGSASIATAPHPSRENGMGYNPPAGTDGSGRALVRGGYWSDGDSAGVFDLDRVSPVRRFDRVGFRCTK